MRTYAHSIFFVPLFFCLLLAHAQKESSFQDEIESAFQACFRQKMHGHYSTWTKLYRPKQLVIIIIGVRIYIITWPFTSMKRTKKRSPRQRMILE